LFVPSLRNREIMRRDLGISNEEIVLIYTGKIFPEKDIDILIKSVSHVTRNFSKLKLLIVGNGAQEYLRYLKKLVELCGIQKNVIFHPTVDRNDLPKYFNAADFGVWPGSPSISIIEAMSAGLPVVIAGYPNPRDDAYDTTNLLKYRNGLSFSRGSVSQLTSCIEKLMCDVNLRKEMGRRSRKYVEKELDWRMIASRYLELYED